MYSPKIKEERQSDARRRLINMLEAIEGVEDEDELAMRVVDTVNKFLNELDIRSDGADIDDYIRRHFSSFGDSM